MSKYIERLIMPDVNDENYYSDKNEMVKYGFPLPNCTTYVHGRWNELGVQNIQLSLNNANTYFSKNDGYVRSQVAQVGAIACWGGGEYGHVAIVEIVNQDGTMIISQSDYISKINFETKTIKQNSNLYGYAFQGYIVCPIDFVEKIPSVKYGVHVQNIGWMEEVHDGDQAGTIGQSKRIEAIRISFENMTGYNFRYRAYVEGQYNPTEWKSAGEVIGTVGESKRLEAIEFDGDIMLEIQEHIQDMGWSPAYINNKGIIGNVGKSLRLEALKIKLV